MADCASGKQAEGRGAGREKQSPAAQADGKCESLGSDPAIPPWTVLMCTRVHCFHEAVAPPPALPTGVTSLALAVLQAQPQPECADPMCRWWATPARDEPFSLAHWGLPG